MKKNIIFPSSKVFCGFKGKMNHQSHIKWFKITSILSSAVFFTWLICLGFLIDQSFDLNTRTLTNLECAFVLGLYISLTLLSNYFDILLYVKSDKDIDTTLRYVVTWEKVCKFKIISAISIVLAYVIALMAYPDHLRAHDLQYLFQILLLTTSGFAQTSIFWKLKFVHEDCIVRCDHGLNVNVTNRSDALNENQVNICNNFGK